jgi:hypothetical protein
MRMTIIKTMLIGVMCSFWISVGIQPAGAQRTIDHPCTADADCPAKANECETNGFCALLNAKKDTCTYLDKGLCYDYNAGDKKRYEEWACLPASGCLPGDCNVSTDCVGKSNQCRIYNCTGGKCVAAGHKNCNDGNPLTYDDCDPATGLCAWQNVPAPDPQGVAIEDRMRPTYDRLLKMELGKNKISESLGDSLKKAFDGDEPEDVSWREWKNFSWSDPAWRDRAVKLAVDTGIDMAVDKMSNADERNFGTGNMKFSLTLKFKLGNKKPPR